MSNHAKALEKIKELEEKFGKGGYIFRGTTECYSEQKGEGGICDGINSTLYRWVVKNDKEGEIAKEQEKLEKIFSENKHFSPSDMEKEIIENARKMFPSNTENHEILTELQHFGGKTNMIDFTRNMYVALFFACQGKFDKHGELIALREKKLTRVDKIDYNNRPQKGALEIIDPAAAQSSRQRVHFQSSIFVRPADGYIKPEPEWCEIEEISDDLKKPISEYLRILHNITEHTVYNDLHGFIKNEKNNETASLYFYMGRACHNKGEYENSVKYYSKSIDLNANKPETYNNRGLVYCDMGQYKLAIEDFSKAISDSSNPAIMYCNRGTAYSEMGQYELAIEDHNKAISLDSNFASAYTNRGNVYDSMEQHERAIEDHNKAISLKPDFAEAYVNRGITYNRMGQHERAIEDHNKAISLKPDFAEAYNNRGNAYNSMEQHERAIEDHNKAISLKPNFAEAYSDRGNAYKCMENYKRAIKDYNKAISLKPNFANAYFNRGLVYIDSRKYEHAIDDFSTAISLKPRFAEAYNYRGVAYFFRSSVYYSQGIHGYLEQLNLAIDDFSKVISLKPDFAEAYFHRGNAYHNLAVAYRAQTVIVNYLEQLNLAIDDLNKAISLKHDYADAYHCRGIAKIKKGDFAGGEADIAKAKELGFVPPKQPSPEQK